MLTPWPVLQVEYAEAKVQWLQELHERECAELEEMLAREYQERVLQEHEKVGGKMRCLNLLSHSGKGKESSHSAVGACISWPGYALRNLFQGNDWRVEARGGISC